MDGKRGGERHSAFFDLERDPKRDSLTRPATMLRSTEWGGLTLLSLLAGLAFPPYFFSVMTLAFLNAGGLLWVTHLNESGRKRLREFEAEFSVGHALEEKGEYPAAAAVYAALVPRYADQPKIARIAEHRAALLRERHPGDFDAKPAAPAPPAAGAASAASAAGAPRARKPARRRAAAKKKAPPGGRRAR
jgi:hypothetical protein